MSGYEFEPVRLSISGNTAGSPFVLNGGVVVLQGGANITISQTSNSLVWIGGAGGGGGSVNFSAGTTSQNLTNVVFSNSNNVSFGLNGSTITATATFAQTNQSAIKGFGASNTGNTAGNTGISTGIDWVIAGSNNITISESTAIGGPNTIWVSGPSVAGAQTGISGIANSQTTYTSGTVSLSDQANITIASSVNGATQIYKFSVAAQSVQTQGITGDQLSIGVSTGGNTLGNTTVNTGQRFVLVGSNGITLSQATGVGSTTITISGVTTAAQTNQSAIKALGVSNTGNTAGNTGVSTGIDWVIAGSNGITASQSTVGGGPNTIWISGVTTVAQSVQTLGIYASSQTTGASSSSTYDARSLSFVFSNNISGGWTNGSFLFNVTTAAQTNQSAIKALGASNTGNTAGNTGVSTGIDWVIAGTNAVTISESTVGGGPNTLWVNAPNAAAGNVTFSAGANSSGLASVIFSNSNGVSFGLGAGSVITASAAGGGGVGGGVSNLGNTAGSTGTVTTGNIVFVGSGVISLSQSTGAAGSNATISILAPATSSLVGANGIEVSTNGSTITVRPTFASYFANIDEVQGTQTMTMLQSTSGMFPFSLGEPISASFVRLLLSGSVLAASSTAATTGNSQFSGGHSRSHNLVIYSRGIGASSMSLQSVTSTQVTERYSINVSAAANSTQFSYSMRYTFPSFSGNIGFTRDYSSSAASLNFHTSHVTDFTGNKVVDLPFEFSLSPGQYWLGYGVSSSTATQRTADLTRGGIAFTNFGVSQMNSAFGTLGAATNSSVNIQPGLGSYSVVGGGTSASIDLTRISSSASQNMLYFQFMRIS